MNIDPQKAAGNSELNGNTFYFCSHHCKEKFDSSTSAKNQDKENLQVKSLKLHDERKSCCHHQPKLLAKEHLPELSENKDVQDNEKNKDNNENKNLLNKFWFAAIVGIVMLLVMLLDIIPALHKITAGWHQVIGVFSAIISLPVILWSGNQFFLGAWNSVKNHNANMDTLVALGTGSAWLYSIVSVLFPKLFPSEMAGMYFDVSVIVIALVLLGQIIEMKAKSKSNEAIKKLIALQAKAARVIRDGKELDLPIEEVIVGDTVLVRPGEKIPVDGVILKGESAIDESMVTGEAIPIDKKTRDKVIGSTINKTGSFTFQATKVGKDTALARIVELVSQAQNTKAPIGKLVDKVSAYFVPTVVIISIITFLLWFNFGPMPSINYAIATMVAVLLIACPCALGLATPISLMVGVGKAAEQGILIRNGEALEKAASLKVVVLDKTGTITKGKPEVVDIITTSNINKNKVLELAAIADLRSEHPLAQAIVEEAKKQGIKLDEPKSFKALPGYGVTAQVEQYQVFVGNEKLMQRENLTYHHLNELIEKLASKGKTPIYVVINKEVVGIIALADTVKSDSLQAINRLEKLGIEVVMMTGDKRLTAEAIAKEVGIKRVQAEVLPEDKANYISQLQNELKQKGITGLVAMVGDGINDAPALAQADVGFAIGTGTDVAIEAAEVTLVGGSLNGVVTAIELSKAILKNIKQNLFGAFIYNLMGVPIAAGLLYPLLGILLSPIIAGAAMAASSITVVTNANRLRFFYSKKMTA
ncbi:MAG: heavy metal translocating P-type ATPase [Blastocatellia bacterium]|nr:heavy metal translocating P-type ATPase [Blastocatellia bacterium]